MSPLPAAAHRVAVDVVTVSLRDDGAGAGTPVFLALRRPRPPFAGDWALPGTLVREGEELEQAALRILADGAGLARPHHLEQLATFGTPDRDPRGRVVSVSYLALVPRPAPVHESAAWWPVSRPPPLGFDHTVILASAMDRLRAKLTYSNVAYGLLPATFTLSELQAVYESVLGQALDKRNFRKKVLALGLVTETEGQRRGPHRPAQLYRFRDAALVVLDDVIATSAGP
ncbi:MAG: NUDIX domain-containing protein [Nitriliruptorales bacterium]|nr:NUDIX domain-containing protein [Nitriliruptorales bacterium]